MGFVSVEEAGSTPERGFVALEDASAASGFVPLEEEELKKKEPSLLNTVSGFTPSTNLMGGVSPTHDVGGAVIDAAKTIPPALVSSVAGVQLSGLEELANANREKGIPNSPELEQDIAEKRGMIGEVHADLIRMTKPRPGFGNDVLRSTLQSLAVMSPGIAASVMTRSMAPALASAGLSTYGQKYAEGSVPADLTETPSDYTTAHHAAMGNAFAEVGFEATPMKYLLENVGKEGLGKLVKNYVIKENLTEIPTTIAQDLVDWAELHPEKSFKDWALETGYDVAVTAVSTPLSAGTVGAGAHATVKASQMVDEYRMQKKLDVLNKNLQQVMGDLTGATSDDERQAIVGRVMESIRTQELDPETAAIQKKQLEGGMADIPGTDFGVSLGKRMDDSKWSKVRQEQEEEVAADEGGIEPSVTDRRNRYLEDGLQDTTPHGDRIIMAQTDPRAVGLKLNQIANLPDGSVTVIGGSALSQESLFPGMLPEAIQQTVQEIAKIVGITAPIIITMEQLAGQEFGRYVTINLDNTGARQAHVINPRELPSLKYGGNQTTLVEFIYALTHEVGHALKMERWERSIKEKGVAAGRDIADIDGVLGAIRTAINTFSVTPEMLATLNTIAPTEAELLSSWNVLQTQARKGLLSGKQLADAWFGPRKFSLGLGRQTGTKSIYDWIEREARRIGITKSIDAMTAQEVVAAIRAKTKKDGTPRMDAHGKPLGDFEYVLNFDEFMAEQFSRASYDRNYLKGTTLGEWFQNALEKLREFFGQMKDQGFIKPQETFNQWLDEQTAISAKIKRGKVWGKVKLSKQLQAAQKAQLAQLQAERDALAVEGELEVGEEAEEEYPLPEDEQVEAEESISVAEAEELLEIMREDLKPGLIKKVEQFLAKGNAVEAMRLLNEAPPQYDRGNPIPEIGPADTASEAEALMSKEELAEAKRLWETMGFESPYFKRWFRDSVMRNAITQEPIRVYRGGGMNIPFFDVTASRWERAFFFSAQPATAAYYTERGLRNATRLKNVSDMRELQNIRMQAMEAKDALDAKVPLPRLTMKQTREKMLAMQKEARIFQELAPQVETIPTIGEFFLRMENPFEWDFEEDHWNHGAYDELIADARRLGHDGLIVRNVQDPLLDTVYIIFDPVQAKDTVYQQGSFTESDLVMWDQQNPQQAALRNVGRVLDKLSPENGWNMVLNGWHRMSDALVQLQQRAAIPLPDGTLDAPMQHMLKSTWDAEAFKNSLQYRGEELVREMWNRNPKDLETLYTILENEWKSGKLMLDLVGWDQHPSRPNAQIIWGNLEDGGQDISAATGKAVKYWGFAPRPEFHEVLSKHGINVDTPEGRAFRDLLVNVKLAMMEQFTELENVLREKIMHRYSTAPAMVAMEIEKLYQVMMKIRQTPFFPQGWYGDWVISIQEKKANSKKGERKYKLVRVEHYQSKTAMQKALKKWYAARDKGDNIKVSWNKREQLQGIPMQLPRNLLEQLAKTGVFTPEQLEVMEEVMVPVGHEKLELRYNKWSEGLLGGERDIVRNFSNFIWHNANFVWKLKFRADFTKALNAQTALWKRAQKDGSPQGMALADKLHRNKQIMERVKEALIHPLYEFQGPRQVAALLYLAYNAKTAIMNLSTMLNTYAGLTMEYGEIAGHKIIMKGSYDTTRMWLLKKAQRDGTLSAQDSEIVWAYDKAVQEGILDQSYAFFLAGQANATSSFQGTRKTWGAKLSHKVQDWGMLPFRLVEKFNRTSTLLMFFEAERLRGAGIQDAYDAAVQRTNLLQNAFNSANRSELFRGKKALLTMFMSYVQFMTWNMYGGYAKAVRADLNARGLKVEHLGGEHAYTLKLILMYMMLGGMFAGPGFEDLMEIIEWVWRKLFKTSARLELRQFVKDIGWNPDLVMHGMLSNVAGMDLSGSFSIGRMIPGMAMLNRQIDTPAEFFGMMATKMAGPFGGFTEDMMKFVTAASAWLHGQARVGEVFKELPGEAGALGKAWDAYTLQQLKPTGAVIDKAGARVVEDPPGSGKFRELTNWELIGMALGGNPAVLSRSREMNFWEVGEQIYWRTKVESLLDNRWKAINTRDAERLEAANKAIADFNKSLPKGYEKLRITGQMQANSIRAHRKKVQNLEQGKASSKRMQPLMNEIKNAQ